MLDLFPRGFRVERRSVSGIALNVCYDATPTPARPPLLLLHGFPQTHAMWHKVAERLRARFTLVLPDLRGYGDSDKPVGPADHSVYSKRTLALDVLTLMRGFGFEQFFVCGHDRGGRVAHRLALDHPQAVRALALLDISPTLTMYERTTMEFARAYYHWFFLIQPAPLPETLIGAAPSFYLRAKLGGWGSEGLEPFDARAGRVRALLLVAGRRARDVRGLPRRGVDRPRPRPRRCRAAHRLPHARAVGRARRRAPVVHAARGLASEVRARSHRARGTHGALHRRGSAGPARRGARSILCMSP
jgi:pimeloyl-ACP methyl ester carboxylesterase